MWGDFLGELEMKKLILVYDGKGKKMGEEWWIIIWVEDVLIRYRVVVEKVSNVVV